MNKPVSNWWGDAVISKLTDCEQNIPRMITELHTVIQDCPYTQKQTRAVICALLEGSLRHGFWAGWRAHARGETLFCPYIKLPRDLRLLPRRCWLLGASAVHHAYHGGILNTTEGHALELVLGALGAIQGQLDFGQEHLLPGPARPSGQ